MGLFDRLLSRENSETEEEFENRIREKKWIAERSLDDLNQSARNHLVDFNAYIANVVRYPKLDSDSKKVSDLLEKPILNKDELGDTLHALRWYEFGTDGYSHNMSEGSYSMADTLCHQFEEGKLTSVHELFDTINQRYKVSEVKYTGVPHYLNGFNPIVLQDAAAFVHDGDTLDDVYKRNEDVYDNAKKDFGVGFNQFAKFKNVEDSFIEGLKYTYGEDYAKRYNGYRLPDFHSSYDVVDYLQEYKDIHNRNLNKKDDKFLTDADLKAFSDFAISNISDVEKENGFSLNFVMCEYDKNKLNYFRDSVSRLQVKSRDKSDCTLNTRYWFMREDTAMDHEDAIKTDAQKRKQLEHKSQVAKRDEERTTVPELELLELPKSMHIKASQKDEGLEP